LLDQLPAGPIIVLTGTGVFVVSLLFGTRRGLVARWLDQQRFEHSLGVRQLLRLAYEAPAATFSADDLRLQKSWTASKVNRLLRDAKSDELVQPAGAGQYQLTDAGRQQALAVTRGHRLWEAFLAAYPEQAGTTANLASPSIEDYVPSAVVAQLTEQLQREGRWPIEGVRESLAEGDHR
jgi:manganese/zinc/iron transport system permease protein